MKYFLIILCVLIVCAITDWWCYGIFQSEALTLSEQYALSAFVAFIGFAMSFMVGVFVNMHYPFSNDDNES